MIKEFLFADRDALITQLATDCRQYLQQALERRGTASLMVSGGSSPAPVYELLSTSDQDWPNIHIALVDERWVDNQHSASNEALIYRTLLINKAEQAVFTGMKNSADSAQTGCTDTETLYRGIPLPYTVTILGMGNDGHTASLFPHARGLNLALQVDSEQLTAAITAEQSNVTGPNTERMTMTLAGLMKSERLVILLIGDEKLSVFRTAMSDLSDSGVADMPIRAVLQQSQTPVELYWAP